MTQSDLSMTPPSTPITMGIIQRIAARFGGAKAKELERFLKFAVVGAIGAVIDLSITNILIKTVLQLRQGDSTPEVLAGICGFTVAVCSNFVWNRYWTYPESRHTGSLWKQLAQFFMVNLVGLGIRALILKSFSIPFGDFIVYEGNIFFPSLIQQWANDGTVRWIGANMAVIMALVIVMMWNFFVNRRFTYKDVK